MDQIEELQPPPNPAKETDTRAKSYIDKFGTTSWELDALEPEYITSLIHNHAEKYIDLDKFEKRRDEEQQEREALITIADKWDTIAETFKDDDNEPDY